MKYETENWPYVEAKHYGPKRTGLVRLGVVHTAEIRESIVSAENLARYFATMPDGRKASAHVCIDSDSVVQSVRDSYVAYAAPGANHDGIHLELCCYMGQTASQWRDYYSLALLAIAADVMAQYCLKYNLPAIHLTDDQLRDGAKGIVGHDQVTRVYQQSDHTDPGPRFPWARFIPMVQALVQERKVG